MPTVTSRDGTPIAYDRIGSGPALILVDGALCSRAFGPMPKLAPLFASSFTVFTYDRRGRGASGDTRPYEVAREVDDLAALIDAAGGSASLLGLSSGAALALEAAASGLNVDKLALYEPPYIAQAAGEGATPNHQARLEELVAAGRRGDAVKYFMKDMVNVPAFFVAIMQLMVPVWSKLKAVAHTLPYDSAVMRDFKVPRERAVTVRVPTLVMAGDKTQPRLIEAVEVLEQAIPGAKRLMLKGQTHNVDGRVLAPVVKEFLQTAVPAAAPVAACCRTQRARVVAFR
jgi:pimeloyl-ACP methyl ester carboxylesterase